MSKKVTGVLDSRHKFRTEIRAANHYLISDEPTQAGGNDDGPDPIMMALSALASCIAMTIRLYTDRKEWKFDRIVVEIDSDSRRVSGDENLTEEEQNFVIDGRLRTVNKHIIIFGKLDDDQVSRIGEIANKCPVNRMMNRNVLMKQTIARS
jgi:uncharacterized OsmC-like protein